MTTRGVRSQTIAASAVALASECLAEIRCRERPRPVQPSSALVAVEPIRSRSIARSWGGGCTMRCPILFARSGNHYAQKAHVAKETDAGRIAVKNNQILI